MSGNLKEKENVQTITAIHQTTPANVPQPPSLPSAQQAVQSQTLISSPTLSQKFNTDLVTPSLTDLSRSSQTQINQNNRVNSQQSLNQGSSNSKLVYLWNAVTTVDMPNQPGKKLTIDRKSWIMRYDEQSTQLYPVIYSLDPSTSLPKNPMGRTGVRGRGALHRYGPNHEIMAIVTRWKKQKNRPIFVERRKLLEFVAVKDTSSGLTKIPGDKILGDESQFSVVCRTFMEMVFEEQDVEKGTNFSEEDMLKFFASFATQDSSVLIPSVTIQLADILNELGFVSTMVYKGYIDDQRNTDNAWIEAEIWNFHYDKDDFFDKRIKNPGNKWRELSSNVRINTNEIIGDVLKEMSEIHNAFYS
jgi:hypothetical protein